MDSTRFDMLARRLASPATRRTALAGLAAALTRLLPGAVAAQPRTTCRELGKVCNPERNLDCCPGTTCRNGRCRCPDGKRRCQGECVSVRRCCGNECPGGAVCREGRCECPRGSRRCGERCVSRQRCCPGQKRCGERCIRREACCGGCPTGQVCRAGRCVRTGCGAGTKPCNGRCILDAACCGDCPATQVCTNGQCGCGAGTKPCDDRCIGDAACCGGCGPTQTCANGQCGCGAGTKPCDGGCIRDDACCAACPANHVCRDATCCIGPNALQAALNEGPDTLRLCPDTRYVGNFSIIRSLTVIGAGMDSSILDGNLTGRVLDIRGGLQVTLQGLRVTRGSLTGGVGGGIRVEPGNNTELTLQDAEVSVNTAPAGGGISILVATLHLRGASRVGDNHATTGAGGGIRSISSIITINDTSAVELNSAGTDGGGIDWYSGSINLTGQSRISANTANDSGGGIYLADSTLALQGSSVIEKNIADADNRGNDGGGVFNFGLPASVTFTDTSCVRGNEPNQCTNATCPVC